MPDSSPRTAWHIDVYHPITSELVASIDVPAEQAIAIAAALYRGAERGGELYLRTAYFGEHAVDGKLSGKPSAKRAI